MKNSFLKVLVSTFSLLGFTSAFPQEAEWKHYEYPAINLQFDLPADYKFVYPDDGSLAFEGHNDITDLHFRRIEKNIPTEEELKKELYIAGGFSFDASTDDNLRSGLSAGGYLFAMTVGYIDEIEEQAVAMLLSDPGNNNLNFFVFVTFGKEYNPESPEHIQAMQILLSFKPIKKQ